KNLTDTLWISHDLNNPVQAIDDIDPKLYPYIQLSFATGDSSSYKPSDIDHWRVYYEGYPEFIINPDDGFEYDNDTLAQGRHLKLRTFIENPTDYAVDSLPVALKIISGSNTAQ